MMCASPLDNGSSGGGGGGYGNTGKPRRVRTSKPKVKTGCNNCKQRRIKCDEKRPACTQCERSKKQCTGYPPPPRAKIYEEKLIAPKPPNPIVALAPIQPRAITPPESPKDNALVLRQPSNIPFSSHEGQYFQLFRDYTANNANRHWEVAFKHYSLAIRAVVNSTSHGQTKERMSLMASVLLACFDSFIGDHRQAIVQIQSGLRLLEKLRAERRQASLPQPEEPVEQDLIQMFTRLAIQAKSYDLAFHFPQPYVIRLTPQVGGTAPSSPDGAWDTLCERIMRFTEHMGAYVKMSPMNILPLELKQYGKGFDEQMEAWSRAFDPILTSRMAPAKSMQEKTAIAVLKMNQIMGRILFNMTFSDSESEFDQFLQSFRDIVNLAMEVIGDEERRAAAKRCPNPDFCQHQPTHTDIFGGEYTARHIKPSFSADLGYSIVTN
ncbi:hypothetical protein ONZ43_g2511 [Nemania bipapillata]|uniref:Uncharacterized protein n=1 Tax=Nemania bipapillata TaxID=110536 RepID=A0ACC2J0D8_9PEZI|nr:hypothetical protein ONZ43_g2511 [Nemania bipapillata]